MAQVPIRNLDDALLLDYQRAAESNGRSLKAELREALAQKRPRTQLDEAGLRTLAHRLWYMTPPESRGGG